MIFESIVDATVQVAVMLPEAAVPASKISLGSCELKSRATDQTLLSDAARATAEG